MKVYEIEAAIAEAILSMYGEDAHSAYVNDRDGVNEAVIEVQRSAEVGRENDYDAAIEKVAREYGEIYTEACTAEAKA